MANKPDVVKRLAQSIQPEAPTPTPTPSRLGPEEQRKFDEGAFSRRAQLGEFDLNDPAVQARLTPDARELVLRRVKEQREAAERQRVIEALRRYWYGPSVIERLGQSLELPAEAVPPADVAPRRNS